MLFCPSCRHQLSPTWAGDVCGFCGTIYKGSDSCSISELPALKTSGAAYFSLLASQGGKNSTSLGHIAAAITMVGLLSIETHFPRVVWNTSSGVRKRYIAALETRFRSNRAEVPRENEYPTSRFIEQANANLRLLYYGEKNRMRLFDPTSEGEFAEAYQGSHTNLVDSVRSWAGSTSRQLGYCDCCGLLGELGPTAAIRQQIAPTCMDCRGTPRPYLDSLKAAGMLHPTRR